MKHGDIYVLTYRTTADPVLVRCNIDADGTEVWFTDKQGNEVVGRILRRHGGPDRSFFNRDV